MVLCFWLDLLDNIFRGLWPMVRHRKFPCRGEGGCCQNFSRTQLRTDHQCPGPPDHPFLPPPNLTPSLIWYIGRGRQKNCFLCDIFQKGREGRANQNPKVLVYFGCWTSNIPESKKNLLEKGYAGLLLAPAEHIVSLSLFHRIDGSLPQTSHKSNSENHNLFGCNTHCCSSPIRPGGGLKFLICSVLVTHGVVRKNKTYIYNFFPVRLYLSRLGIWNEKLKQNILIRSN